jgi:hypothetical protein
VAAAQAQAQVHPPVAHLQTLFTAPGMGLHILNLIEMRTFAHRDSPFNLLEVTVVHRRLRF